MKLYTYFQSSAAYRVRIALNLKGLQAEQLPVHLLKNGGEQFNTSFDAVNPQHLVPVLVDQDFVLAQSLAIIEYLDETYPGPALLPAEARARARVRALSQLIACDIHPLNNLRVLKYLSKQLGIAPADRNDWYRHWIAVGLSALERQLAGHRDTGRFCHGDAPTLADCCLVPQVFNARRLSCDLSPYPTIRVITEHCEGLKAFERARPAMQIDAE